jgi:L-amino acid N-acyltransferase YncA
VQRRGVGRVLLERLLVEAEQRGFRQMVAVIGDSATTPSIALHAALGFRMVGNFESVGFKFGRWLDSVLMQKPLGDGAATAP